MKKIIALILTATMLTAVPVYADRIDDQIEKLKKQINILQTQLEKLEKQKAQEEGTAQPEEEVRSITDDGNTFTYLKTDVVTEEAKLYAVVYYSYLNNSGKEQTPGYALDDTVFQNGLELQTGYLYDVDIPEHDLMYKEIMDGTTVTVANIYELTDMSDITIKLQPMFSWDDSKACRFTVNLIQQ